MSFVRLEGLQRGCAQGGFRSGRELYSVRLHGFLRAW